MKIAICFSGASRDFETCLPSIQKYLFQNNNIDFFLHLWRSDEVDNIQYDFKWKKYNNDINKLVKILNPKKFIIDKYSNIWEEKILSESKIDPTKFTTIEAKNYGFNCCSMYYKIRECYKLVEDYMQEMNFTYDLIIRARLDFIWEDYFNISNIDPKSLYLVRDRYATCSKFITNDKYFAGSPEIMKIMCYIFDKLHEYQSDGIILDGQVVNEYHIKKNNLKVEWVGHKDTYYKCLPRHKISMNYQEVFIENNNNETFLGEIAYILLYNGYNVYYLNKVHEKEKYLENFSNFNYFEKIYDIEDKHLENLNKIGDVLDEEDFIVLSINTNKIKIYKNIFINLNNFKHLTYFFMSLIDNKIKDNNYIFANNKEIKIIENNEIVIFKYLDRGYYKLNLICEKNNYFVNFMNSLKKVNRNTFRIKDIHKYYENFYLPY